MRSRGATLSTFQGPVPDGARAKRFQLPPRSRQRAGEDMNTETSLYGRLASGCLVVISTAPPAAARYDAMEATKVAAWAAWAASNCGAVLFSTLSRFHTTAPASNSEPSWNATPRRRRKVQTTRLDGSADQLSASPGRRRALLSPRESSYAVSAS